MKSILISKIYLYGLFVLSVVLFSSCTSTETIVVTKAPKPQIIAKDNKPRIMPAGYLKLQIRKQLPELEELVISDKNYVYISKKWFLQMDDWTRTFIHEQVPNLDSNDLPTVYRESYIMFLSSIANFQIAKHYNIKSSALIGILVAANIEPWGAIPASGKNMSYMIVLSGSSMLVYDIVTRQLCKIYDFPNLKHTKKIFF